MTREIVQEVFKVYPSGRSVKKHLLCISFVHLYSFVLAFVLICTPEITLTLSFTIFIYKKEDYST